MPDWFFRWQDADSVLCSEGGPGLRSTQAAKKHVDTVLSEPRTLKSSPNYPSRAEHAAKRLSSTRVIVERSMIAGGPLYTNDQVDCEGFNTNLFCVDGVLCCQGIPAGTNCPESSGSLFPLTAGSKLNVPPTERHTTERHIPGPTNISDNIAYHPPHLHRTIRNSSAMTEFAAENVRVTFIGQLPPPITGMNLMTEVIVRALEHKTTVRRFGWTSRQPIETLKSFSGHCSRLTFVAKSAVRLLFSSPGRGEFVYLSANSNWGMIYDTVIASIARLRRFRIALHHHGYNYFDRYDWRMATINKLVGHNGIHVVHCRKMEDDFRARYDSAATFMWVSPAIVSSRSETMVNVRLRSAERPDRRFTIGLMSNLFLAKGLVAAINTLECLLAGQHDVRLILAGPCMSSKEQGIIDRALIRLAGRIEYRGPVYNANKVRFFADIDAFVFPTKSESWGIVLTEAMAAGRPVIVFDRGCISWFVRNGCGRVVAKDGNFEKEASELIAKWIVDPQEYWQACECALQQFATLKEVAGQELDAFTDLLACRQ